MMKMGGSIEAVARKPTSMVAVGGGAGRWAVVVGGRTGTVRN